MSERIISAESKSAIIPYDSFKSTTQHLCAALAITNIGVIWHGWGFPGSTLLAVLVLTNALVAGGWYLFKSSRDAHYTPLRIDEELLRGPNKYGGEEVLRWQEMHRLEIQNAHMSAFFHSHLRPWRPWLKSPFALSITLVAQTKSGDMARFELPHLNGREWVELKVILTHYAQQHGFTFVSGEAVGFAE